MKVMIVSTNSDEAGAPRHSETLIQGYAGRHDVHFVTGEQGAVFSRLSGIVPCHLIPQMRSRISPLRDLVALVCLIRLIYRVKPDIVHAHSSKACMLSMISCCALGVPCVVTIHGFAWRGFKQAKAAVIAVVDRILHFFCRPKAILVSEQMRPAARDILGIRPPKMEVVLNCIPDCDPKFVVTHTKRDIVRLIMPARVCSAKDHLSLFKAMSMLDEGFSLTLAGSGTADLSFRRLAAEVMGKNQSRVRFLGEVSNMQELLVEHDVFVLISHFEAFPISILEAMRAGLPVLASDVGGVSEVVDADIGALIPREDHASLAIEIKNISPSPIRTELGRRARARFLKKYTANIMLEKIERIYRQEIAERLQYEA